MTDVKEVWRKNYSKDDFQKRIIFLDEKVNVYLEYYNKVDIGLDTFLYSGATTTYGALCMGVPVLSLTGKNYITRQSASVLSNIGLSDWIIKKENEYIETLKKLANYKTISKLRSTLRKNRSPCSACLRIAVSRSTNIETSGCWSIRSLSNMSVIKTFGTTEPVL